MESWASPRSDWGGAFLVSRRRAGLTLAGVGAASVIAVMAAATALSSSQASAPAQRGTIADPAPARVVPSAKSVQQPELPIKRFTGRVGEDLSASLLAAGVPELQGRQYVAVLRRAIDLGSGLSVDDRFDLIIERGDDGDLGQLLYVGLDRVARADIELLKWTDGKNVIWVNGDGIGGEDTSRLRMPVRGRLSSRYGNRFHPILGYARFHRGVDVAAASGTPIVAAAPGKVVSAGWHGGYGKQVEIAHADGIETSYGHMSRVAANIGQVVRKGEVIGWVGSTGLSTGPHLHFEVTRNGQPVNPMNVKMGTGPKQLEGQQLQVFHGELRKLLLDGNS